MLLISIKRDFQAFENHIENQSSRLTRSDLSSGPDKKNSSAWRHTPFCFFVSFFGLLFALKKSGLKVDEVLKKIDFNNFGPFLGSKNAFFARLRRFLDLIFMLIAFAFQFPII